MKPLLQLSAYQNAHDTTGVTVSFAAVLKRIRDGKHGLLEKTRLCNVLAKTDPNAYRDYKSRELPAVTFAGTFPTGKRQAAHLITHSGLVVLDIDDLSETLIPDILAEFAQHPHVRLAFLSPSGLGIKVVCPVDPVPIDAAQHKAAWQACVDFFQPLADEYDFDIDPSGKDVNRLCFLAHDPQAILHPEAIPIQWDREAWIAEQAERQKQRAELENRDWGDSDVDKAALDHIDPDALAYDDWLRVIIACKSAGVTWQAVDAWSRRGQKHQEGDIQRRWDGLRTGEVSWGTVVHFAQQHGYILPQRTHRKPKLHRADDTPREPTQTLDDNRDQRAEATETFLRKRSGDTLNILLIKDQTGTGKTQTILTKAKQHGKRPIAQLPHGELARQAVEMAFTMGFTDPFHLQGRAHNWDASGIADIPVSERTPALFEKNNCIMVDVLKKYTDKRLAPRTFCESKCPFRDGCPHLAQYEGLGERDFVATCTPNVLFDLNFRGYLTSIVSDTNEPTDEELAIDAMIGTKSAAPKAFDLAILDDYGINGLFTDITFTASEFKALQTAWKGTPTGEFATLLLKAFKKKKPQKILKALRQAFQATAEHHESIAKALTQHARIGTIEYAEHPKSSKETRRLLTEKVIKYDDGGQQFIPVDFDAYQELEDKDIPSVNPQHLQTNAVGEQVRVPHAPTHALLAGVAVEDLTPVWQHGATPVDMIRIFLDSIGSAENAPINRTFRGTCDPPVAVLTFSIPPQAPVGILPHIAMLSATTDTEDVQRAFHGQDVTFSEHTGGQLEWADGAQVYQFQDIRLTASSIFEYPKDADGKRKRQEDPIGLTPTAEKRLQKLNQWAKATDGRTAFISYKEFTQQFRETVDGFDIVTHFDKVAGLNFDGLKFLVVFGYPKVKHEVVMAQARKQYASDCEPLPSGTYEALTETAEYDENGTTSTECRYKDPRLEKIRHQLATEKLQQAIGRARLPLWTDTQTLIFTNAPVGGITERATLFSSRAFDRADTPSDIQNALARIKTAEDSGDVKAIMETKGIKKSQAYNDSKEVRAQKKADRDARIIELHTEGKSQREIEKQMKSEGYQKVGKTTIQKVVTISSLQLVYTNYEVEKVTTPSDVGVPCVESENTKNRTGAQKPVPHTEYAKLSEDDARAERQNCEDRFDSNAAASLRSLFKRNGWEVVRCGGT